MKRKTIVFILSSGHSGSTVLDLAIGGHPECFSLGEVSELQKEVDNNTACVCGENILNCKFWSDVREDLYNNSGNICDPGAGLSLMPEQNADQSWGARINELTEIAGIVSREEKWSANTHDLYESIFRVTNANILVDSSKNLKRALLVRRRCRDYNIKFLHLIRDVRGVAYSYSKKQYAVRLPGQDLKIVDRDKDVLSIEEACRTWERYNRKITMALKIFVPSNDSMRVNYERLCASPDAMLKSICDWLVLRYDKDMLRFSSKAHHNVSGNPSRFNCKGLNASDEVWRKALSAEAQHRCLRIAGRLNRSFGYKK